ncbi:MAG: Ig-like domain-containing protein [Bacteroidota bacterium]
MRKTIYTFLTGFLLPVAGFSQTSIPANSLVTQNFNSMGATATANLPANWKMSSAGTGNSSGWATGTNTTTTTQAASSGSPAIGGRYNWATSAGTDRAIGFMSDAAYGDTSAIFSWYRNTTGAIVTSITVSYNVERYRINTGHANLFLFSSADGTAWTARPAGDIPAGAFETAAGSYTFNTPKSIYKTVVITGLSIANNSDFYLRWVIRTGGNGAASQGIALDDVVLYAASATPVVSSSLRDAMLVDNNGNGTVDGGDHLRYTNVIRNTGTGNATGVNLNDPAPTNTTLNAGSVKTSALARNDNYNTALNTVLNSGNVLTNDFGMPAPAVLSFGPTANPGATAAAGTGSSDNGGAVTLNADGTFTYTPLTGFSGIDKFSYIAATGTLPNNDAIVSVTVGTAATVANEAYAVTGNVAILPNAAQGVLANDGGGGLFVSSVNSSATNVNANILTANGGNLFVNTNGGFTYNPPKGFEGADNFTYTANNGIGTQSTTATVTLNVTGMIWFINSAAAAGGDGRLTTPFNSIDAFQAVNAGGAAQPAANDYIFVYEGAAYASTTTLQLLTGQKLVGQDASAQLSTITSLAPAVYSMPFPVTDVAAPFVTLTTSGSGIHGVALGSNNNVVRGLTIGNVSGAKIFANVFGTATLGNTTNPDLTLNGTGQALNLTTGALSATRFTSVTTTSSTAQGIVLTGVTSTAPVNFGSTNISGSTTQGILIGTTTADLNFGNTAVSSGTDGLSFQNNSAGTRTFGTLGITTNGAGTGFLHGAGGGAVTAGVTTTSNTGGTGIGISIQNANADIIFGATTVTKTGAGTGVSIGSSAAGNDVSFASLDITTANGAGLVGTNNAGQIIVTAATGDINATNGAAINLSQAAGTSTVNLNFSAASSSGAANGISLTRIAGTIAIGGGTITGSATGAAFNMSLGSATVSYAGSITQNAANRVIVIDGTTAGTVTFSTGTITGGAGSTGVNINSANGNVTFANLNLGTSVGRMAAVPVTITGGTGTFNLGAVAIYSAGVTAVASSNTDGTINIVSGTVDATTGAALSISGPVGLTTVGIGATTLSTGGTNNVNFTNCTGSVSLGAGTMSGASGASFNVVGCSAFATTYNGTITQAGNAAMVNVNAHASGTLTFNTGLLNATNGTGLQFDNADGVYNFNGNITLNGGDAGIDIINGSGGNFTFLNAPITNPTGAAFLVSGGAGTISHAGTISKTSAGRLINIASRTGGTVSFSGNLSSTGLATGIIVNACSGGAVTTFSGTTKTFNTGTNAAITLTSNTGAPVNFTNGGLDIDVTTGTGFSATGGGTISITGSNNHITAGTGRAINVDGTTIGPTGITLQDVSASGASTNTIHLKNAGSGGFTITGTGTTAGSGGTINHVSAGTTDETYSIATHSFSPNLFATGIGIYVNNTSNISVTNMNFTGSFGNFAIRGETVNNFTLTGSNFTGVYGTNINGAVQEGAIRFGVQSDDGFGNGLTGTVFFTGNNIGGGIADNIAIFNNTSGSMNMTVNDGAAPAIFGHNGFDGNDAILIETRGPANGAVFGTPGGVAGAGFNLTLSVNGVEFKGARGDNIQTVATTNCTQNITITNNTFFNTHPHIVSGGGGITLSGGSPTSNYVATYNISNNQFKGALGTPLHVNYSGQGATVNGIIVSNTIGTPNGTYNSAASQVGSSDNGNGINVTSEKFGDNVPGEPHSTGILNHAVRIQNNVVADINGLAGIRISAGTQDPGGSLRLEATITGNTVAEMGPFGYAAFYAVVGGASLTTDYSKVGLNITGNTFNAGGAGATGNGNAMSFDQISVNARYYFPGYAGSQYGESTAPPGPGTASANLNTFLQNATHLNVLTNGPFPNPAAGAGSKVDATLAVGVVGTAFLLPVPLMASGTPLSNNIVEKKNMLTAAKMKSIHEAAIRRWISAGANKRHVQKMRAVVIKIDEVAGNFIGTSEKGIIKLDKNAAGYGWFFDQTPYDDREFANKNTLHSYVHINAKGKMDLLTVLMHELGHQIGLDDNYLDHESPTLMYGYINPGERRLPKSMHSKKSVWAKNKKQN